MSYQQSFMEVFVTNSPTLLAEGKTVENIGVGQVGILDGKTHKGVTAPTYAKNKAIRFVWGTPDLDYLPLNAGLGNDHIFSKLVKGKRIKGFTAKRASRPQTQQISIGWSGGVSDTASLTAEPGETRYLYLKLTGTPIDKLYSTQGIVRSYEFKVPEGDNCGTGCEPANCKAIAEEFVKQINADQQVNKFIRAKSVIECTPDLTDPATQTIYKFTVSVCDTQDGFALGIVQAQYPNDLVTRIGTSGSSSIYEIQRTANTLPSAVSNAGFIIIPQCATCPSGYTLTPGGFVYLIKREDAGTSGAATTLASDYAIAATGESVSRIAYEFGQSSYVVVSTVALTASGVDNLTLVGQSANNCVLTTPSTFAWVANGTLTKYAKVYRLTVADDTCGVNRLTAIQAAYPDLVVTLVSGSGSCVHTYETTAYSNAVEAGCAAEQIIYTRPQNFEGAQWVEVPVTLADGTTCQCGIIIDVAFVNRFTNECTFDSFPFEWETIFVQASTVNPDYNAPSDTSDWEVKELRGFKPALGLGDAVRSLEQKALDYHLRSRSHDPILREYEQYGFQAQSGVYYDEYCIEYAFTFPTGGWSQDYVDNYRHYFFFPEGQGAAFETAINTYLASSLIQEDPVVL